MGSGGRHPPGSAFEPTRREFVAGTVAAGASLLDNHAADARATPASYRRRSGRSQTAVVLGGGVAGLTVAHELAERGFAVTVYERRALGGKARSVSVPRTATAGRRPLPGEHGMRTFPGFYENLPDTLRRIPVAGTSGGVFDNLVGCSQLEFARGGRRSALTLPLTVSPAWTAAQLSQTLTALLQAGFGLPPQEAAYFASRLLVFLSSCRERRLGEWERSSWASFVNSSRYSREYQRLLTGWINRQLLAARAEDVSALTVAILWQAGVYNLMGRTGNGPFDRVLNLPTNEAWIDPWVAHLRHLGVRFEHAEVTRLRIHRGRVAGAAVAVPTTAARTGGVRRHALRSIEGDWYILAVPVERAVPLIDAEVLRGDPGLASIVALRTAPEAGIQFYLRRQVPIAHGHVLYVDSPWALSSISQAQFWSERDFARSYGNGTVRDCVSVDIADWETPGLLYGRAARECTSTQLADEVWAQLRAGLAGDGNPPLTDELLAGWFIDPGLRFSRGAMSSEDPLLISTPGSWSRRPGAATGIPNLFLAADYVQTQINTACMEGANEAARRAVNALLDASGSRAPRAAVYEPYQPPEFDALKQIDARRYAAGQPNQFDLPPPPA